MPRLTFLSSLLAFCCCSAQTEQLTLPDKTIQTALVEEINTLRATGCTCGDRFFDKTSPLAWNDLLAEAAEIHTRDMEQKGFFDHRGSDGSSAGDRIRRVGYSWTAYGENIGWGYTSVAQVVQGWKDSPGHCELMMDPKFKEMGAARIGTLWTLDLGRR